MKDTLLIGIGKRMIVSPAVTIVLGTGLGATLIDEVEKLHLWGLGLLPLLHSAYHSPPGNC